MDAWTPRDHDSPCHVHARPKTTPSSQGDGDPIGQHLGVRHGPLAMTQIVVPVRVLPELQREQPEAIRDSRAIEIVGLRGDREFAGEGNQRDDPSAVTRLDPQCEVRVGHVEDGIKRHTTSKKKTARSRYLPTSWKLSCCRTVLPK